MKKHIAVAAIAGLFSLAAFAQASNPQAAPAQGGMPAPAPTAQLAAPAPMNQPGEKAAPTKHKHHRHHHHHKSAASSQATASKSGTYNQ
jgi:hypothetical protein